MKRRLYEILELKSDSEIGILAKELLELDGDTLLKEDGEIRKLMKENPNYNLMKIRAEINYEVLNRFIKLV